MHLTLPLFSHIQKIPVLAEIKDAKAKKRKKKGNRSNAGKNRSAHSSRKRISKEQYVVLSELHVLVSMHADMWARYRDSLPGACLIHAA